MGILNKYAAGEYDESVNSKNVIIIMLYNHFVLLLNLQKDTPGRNDTSFRFLMAKNIQRPQLKFKDKIDNSNTPFIPIIKSKPNALRPLEISKFTSISCMFISLIATDS